jgi:opacity protein-like surface antigen
MKKKTIIALVGLLLLSGTLQAQWRLGVEAGATYNHYSIDKQYMSDYRYENGWGATAGVKAQYNFFDWLGLRAGMYFTQRSYRHTRAERPGWLNMRYDNNYLLFPVTVNFSFGGQKVRGFVDLGVYGGCWLNTQRHGRDNNSFTARAYDIHETMEWNDKRDQRGDFGYTGGVGLEYKFLPNWAVQIEAVCYYSVVSATKQYMSHVKDYRYHTTLGLQAGVSYVF